MTSERRKIVLLAVLVVITATLATTASIRPGHAACVGCEVVLDANSISTTDAIVATSATQTKTFRIGAVVTGVSPTNSIEVFAWQFAISYDPNVLIPQADPLLANLGVDEAADLTVKHGTSALPGTSPASASWSALLSTGQASSPIAIDHRPADGVGRITIAYTILAPATARRITANNLLANVAFELVSKPAGPLSVGIGDINLIDGTGTKFLDVTVGTTITETITNDPPVAMATVTPDGSTEAPYDFSFDGSASSDSDGSIATYVWDFGDGIIDYISGATVIHDYGLAGKFTATLRVIDDLGATGAAKDAFGTALLNNQPSHTSLALVANINPTASFTVSDITPNVGDIVNFDGSASSDTDGTIVEFKWNFGDGTPEVATTEATTSHTYTAEGMFTAVLTVKDDLDGTGTTSQLIDVSMVVTNHDPTLSGIPASPRSLDEGATLSFDVTANDVDVGQTLTLSATGLASGMSFPGATGTSPVMSTFTFTPSELQGGQSFTVTFTVTDGAGGTASTQLMINVVEVNEDPALSGIPASPVSVNEGGSLSFEVTATDSDVPQQTLTLSATGLASGMSFPSATGVSPQSTTFSFTASELQGGQSFPVTFMVNDGAGGVVSQQLTINVVELNEAPTLSGIPTSPQNVNEGGTLSFQVSATDADDGPKQTLTLSATGLVSGMTFPGATGTSPINSMFTFNPSELQGGMSFTVTFRVGDGVTETTVELTINVVETNENPVLSGIPVSPMSVSFGGTLTFDVTATDADIPAQTLSLSASDLVVGMSFPGATGASPIMSTFMFTPSEAQIGMSFIVTFNANDGAGGTASRQLTINVIGVNRNPTLSGIPASPQSVDEGGTLTFDVTASDLDIGQTVTLSASGLVSGMTFQDKTGSSPQTSTFTFVPSELQGGMSFIVTFTAKDDVGGTVSVELTINVVEKNSAPTASFTLDKTTVTDNEPIMLTDTSTDPDVPSNLDTITIDWGDGATVTISPGAQATHAYGPLGIYTSVTFQVKVTAMDTGGLSNMVEKTVTVVNHAPVAVIAAPSSGFTNEMIHFDGSGSSDPDAAFGDTITAYEWDFGDGVTGSGAMVDHVYINPGTFRVTLTVMDNHGGTGMAEVQIQITQPTISGALVHGKASPKFHHQDLSKNPDNIFRAVGKNTGDVAAFFYVQFEVKNDQGVVVATVYTQVVELQSGDIIVGSRDPRFTAIFPTSDTDGDDNILGTADDLGPGSYSVTATIFSSTDNIIDAGDTPDLSSQKKFNFTAVP